MNRRCTKKITIHLNGEATKVRFTGNQVYALGPDGALIRVRHRRELPQSHSSDGVMVWVVPAEVQLDARTKSHAADLLAERHGTRLGRLVEGSIAGRCAQGARSGAVPAGFARTTSTRGTLGEGGAGLKRPELDELRVLATNMRGGGATWYETNEERRARARGLVEALVIDDPDALVELLVELRSGHKMRTTAVALAVDAVMAGHRDPSAVLEAALQRPDEPALALRYYLDTYGQGRANIPGALKRGVGRAAVRMWDEAAVLSFDRVRNRGIDGERTESGPVTMTDVVRLCHPKPRDERQAALLRYLASGRTVLDAQQLPRLAARNELLRQDNATRWVTLARAEASVLEAVSGAEEGGDLRGRRHVSVEGPLGVLPWRDVLAWAPPTVAQKEARQQLEAARDALRAHAELFRAELGTCVRIGHRLNKLARYQSKDTDAAWQLDWAAQSGRSEVRTGALAASLERRAAREAKMARLGDELAAMREIEAAQARLKLAVRTAEERAEELSGASAAAWTVAAARMGYKDTMTNLANVAANCPVEVVQMCADKVADVELSLEANVQIPDLMTAAQVLLPSRRDVWGEPLAPAIELPEPSRQVVLGALDTLGDQLVSSVVPTLEDKRVLVMVDGSGSMSMEAQSQRGDQRAGAFAGLSRAEVASAFAGMLSRAGERVEVVAYDTQWHDVDTASQASWVSTASSVSDACLGGGTDTWGVLMERYDEHDIVVILTDEQTRWSPFVDPSVHGYNPYHWSRTPPQRRELPQDCKVITCNLAGDEFSHGAAHANHLTLSGVSTAVFDGVAAAVRGEALNPVADVTGSAGRRD